MFNSLHTQSKQYLQDIHILNGLVNYSPLRNCSDVCSGTTVIQAMKFQIAEMTIYPISFNKTNCDHLIYEPQDIQKVFKNIKLKNI